MKTKEFEPLIIVPFKLGKTVTKVEIKKISTDKIEAYNDIFLSNKTDEMLELEDLQTDLSFLLRELGTTDISSSRVRELSNEIKTTRAQIRMLEKETKDELKQLQEDRDKSICLEVANNNKKTIEFFEKVSEQYSWLHLSTLINLAYREYEDNFLKD